MGQTTWPRGSAKLKSSRQAAPPLNRVAQEQIPRLGPASASTSTSATGERHLSHESVTLFSNIALDTLSSSKRCSKPEVGDLEKRFWKDGGVEASRSSKIHSATGGTAFWSLAPPEVSHNQLISTLLVRGGFSGCGGGDGVEIDFGQLPFDVVRRVCGGFSWPNLWAASLVCKSWYQALAPLREAVSFVKWGKMFKHGRGGVAQNTDKALESFLKGATRGCAAAMIDAGLLLWEQGKREEGIRWYKKAAELGDVAGQCNLGLALLQEPGEPAEAVKWFQRAADAGHVRAQYSLALCLQQGRGVESNPIKAAKWYLRAAEGGSTRAMYNTALCFLSGEGFTRNYHEARHWMRCAALAGHRKAQFEHGLTLFAEGDGGLALAFLELATRAGETAAIHIRDALVQQLPAQERANALACADNWKKHMSR